MSMQHQFEAIRKLYDAAVMMPNPSLMEQYRQQLHDLLDSQLDNQNEIMEYTRQVIKNV